MYHSTESARTADLVLPAAGWGEKTGCFINSERRIGTTKAVCKAPGMALSDFRIFRLIAQAWGCGDLFGKWTHPEAAFKLLRNLTRDRPCDITGIDGELKPMQTATLVVHSGGSSFEIPLKVRLDTPAEVDYYVAGGILPYVLDQILA